MNEIYKTIRNMREDCDLKQKDVADILKMSRTTYNHYELGHSSFTADMIVELANLFQTTPNVLLDFNSSDEITEPELVKLCNFVKEQNINIDALIELISVCKKLMS